MLDPFPIPPPRFLVSLIKPYADALSLHTLPLHFHEVIFAAALYFFTCNVFSPLVSARLCPNTYPRLSRRTKLNWDVHVVSFVQAIIINTISLYIIWFDEERKEWRGNENWEQRIWGYYGSGGLCQSFALGYFLWDFSICSRYTDIFGWGMLAHAVSAVLVFGLGYRPFIYFSAPIFLLYELSSPFLNIHWFCDKLDLTGSIYQAINGAFLTGSFFGCRIVWGIYSSLWVFRDMYWAYRDGHTNFATVVPSGKLSTLSVDELLAVSRDVKGQTTAFGQEQFVPIWIPLIYLLSNLVLNSLNIFWFGKMIETIRTRFDPPWGTRGVSSGTVHYQPVTTEDEDSDLGVGEPGKVREPRAVQLGFADGSAKKKKGSVKAARQRAEDAMNGPVDSDDATHVQRGVADDGTKSVEVTGTQRRSARSRRKA